MRGRWTALGACLAVLWASACAPAVGASEQDAAVCDVAEGACGSVPEEARAAAVAKRGEQDWEIQKTEAEWRELLTEEQYYILRESGTERAFTGKYDGHKEEGVYVVAGIGVPVFHSSAKYDSGSGWPSFYEPISPDAVAELPDYSFFMRRIEIVDAKSGSHLGHVFNDGPPPTGLRYCINSAALEFIPQAEWDRMQAEAAAGTALASE